MSAPHAAAFARIATNVAVITVRDGAGAHGSTANVWAEPCAPPLLLMTLRRGGETLRRIRSAERFAVNLLAAGQEEVAVAFASSARDRLAAVDHHAGRLDQPLLDDALSAFECTLRDRFPFGDYEIVVGETAGSEVGADRQPLLHYAGAFRRLAEASR
jgi:flavin reductase (DIM6/NTAB) family NADH-FMN oxidoreductase RutF